MGNDLAGVYPRLFHVAHADAWPSIERNGLLSTSALMDLFEVQPAARRDIERRRRPGSVTISHPVHGTANIRDQKPLVEKRLVESLVGMTAEEWYEFLNHHVFLWPTEKRVMTMLRARAYREQSQLVLTIDTKALLDRSASDVLLSRINSGAT